MEVNSRGYAARLTTARSSSINKFLKQGWLPRTIPYNSVKNQAAVYRRYPFFSSLGTTCRSRESRIRKSNNNIVDLVIKILPAIVVLLGLVASKLSANRSQSYTYLLLTIACLTFIEIELYRVHKLRHSDTFELPRLLLSGAFGLFFATGALYCAFTEFVAEVHFDYREMVDPQQPFSTKFSATNNGDTLHYVFWLCRENGGQFANGLKVRPFEASGFLSWQFNHDDTTDLGCVAPMSPNNPLIYANVEVGLIFYSTFKHNMEGRCAHFVAYPEGTAVAWTQHLNPDQDCQDILTEMSFALPPR